MSLINKIDPNNLLWQKLRENVDVKNLSDDELKITLVKLAPNSSFDEHSHETTEWLYIVDGEYTDNYSTYSKGDFVINKKRSIHATKSGNKGCTVLVIKCNNDQS